MYNEANGKIGIGEFARKRKSATKNRLKRVDCAISQVECDLEFY